jgi:hypothetical protein
MIGPEKNKPVGAPKKAEKKDDFNRKFKFEEPSLSETVNRLL